MTARAPRGAATVLGVLALTNLIAYGTRNSLFNVYPTLRDQFDLHDAKLGLLATAFLLPHALATLPFGWLGDRYDRRRVIAAGLLVASVAGAAGMFATNLTTLVISRAFVGLGTAAVVPVANSIIGQLYDGPGKASRIAIFNLGLLFGGAAGFVLGGVLGFPPVLIAFAVPGVVLAAVILVLPVPPHPGQLAHAAAHASTGTAGTSGYLAAVGKTFVAEARELLAIRTLRWVMGSTIAMAFAAGGYNAWLIDFLEQDKGMSPPAATRLLSVALLGAVAGVVAGGRIADAMRRRYLAGRLWTMVAGMALTIPSAIACILLPPGVALYAAGIATFFFSFWYHAPMAVTVDDLAPPAKVVAAQGLVIFTMHLVGTAPASWIVGAVQQAYSPFVAMWVPTGALVIAAACMTAATPSFAREHAKAKGGEPAPASL